MRGWVLTLILVVLSVHRGWGEGGTFSYLSSILLAEAKDVEVSGDRAYALFSPGLLVVDIHDPADPRLLGHYFFTEAPTDLRLMGDMAVVADDRAGIRLIDLADPANPVLKGVYPPDNGAPMEAMGLDLQGDTLFVANGSYGLLVLSLADPEHPDSISALGGVTPSWSVDVEGGYAYVAALGNGLYVVDVANLPEMERVAQVKGYPCPRLSEDIRLSLAHAYVADNVTLAVVDVAKPLQPVVRSCIDTPGRELDVFIEFPYLYLAADVAGFHILDMSVNPDIPVWQSTVDTPDDARGIAVNSGIAVVADDFSGLMVFDVSDPMNPESLGVFASAGESRDGVIVGNLALIAQGDRGLAIVDVTDPRQPEIVSTYADSISFVHSLDVRGTLVALANGFRGLMTLDVSEPSVPSYLDEVGTGKKVVGVQIMGDFAYMVDPDFHAVDISDPSVLRLVSSFHTPGDARDLALAGNLAFVADFSEGVLSFDISHPSDTLRLLDALDIPGYAVGIVARDGLLYVADSHPFNGGFRVFRYDAGGRLEEVNYLDLEDPVVDVALKGDVTYLALQGGEIVAVDVREPTSPVVMDRFPTPGQTVSVEAGSTIVLVSDKSSTIFLEFSLTTGIENNPGEETPYPIETDLLRQNYPNPFNPSTTIPFSLRPREGGGGDDIPVTLDLYSVRGRLVRRLFSDRLMGGEHVVTWDGTNSEGVAMPSGVYLYILKIGDARVARKMLLVR